MITEIATLAVLVSDTERSKKWFKDKLGFEIKEDEDHWVVVAPAGSKTGIHLCKTVNSNQAIREYSFSLMTWTQPARN